MEREKKAKATEERKKRMKWPNEGDKKVFFRITYTDTRSRMQSPIRYDAIVYNYYPNESQILLLHHYFFILFMILNYRSK
jgi:hypothetical protein